MIADEAAVAMPVVGFSEAPMAGANRRRTERGIALQGGRDRCTLG